MNKIDHAEKLLQLTEEGTSPFHVTASVERQFQEAGFKKVQLGKGRPLLSGSPWNQSGGVCHREMLPDR